MNEPTQKNTEINLPEYTPKALEMIYNRAVNQREMLNVILSIHKSKDIIDKARKLLTTKKDRVQYREYLRKIREKVVKVKAIDSQMEIVQKRNGDFITIRRLMDVIQSKTSIYSSNLEQVEALLELGFLYCICANPHIKNIQATYHLFQLFLSLRIKQHSIFQDQLKEYSNSGNVNADVLRLKKWLGYEGKVMKAHKESSSSIKLSGAGELLAEEFSDKEWEILLEHKHLPESQVGKEIKNLRKKFYFIYGNMATIPPLIPYIRQFIRPMIGGKDQIHSLQDLAILNCMLRTYIQDISRLQQYVQLSPTEIQKKILKILKEVNPYIFAGLQKIAQNPREHFELLLLESIASYLMYYLLVMGITLRSEQIKTPEVQTMIQGTIDKLSSEKGNKKARDLLQKQFLRAMELVQKE